MPDPVRLRIDKQSLGIFTNLLLWKHRCAISEALFSHLQSNLTRYIDPDKLYVLSGEPKLAERAAGSPHNDLYARILDSWLPT